MSGITDWNSSVKPQMRTQQWDQDIDLPDLDDEWQHQRDAGPDQVETDEHDFSQSRRHQGHTLPATT